MRYNIVILLGKRVHIHLSTLGCRLNEAELESWASDFRAGGHQIVHQPEEADVLVLNTCAVTREAVRKSRKSIQRLHRRNASARLVVSGCYSTLSSEAEHRELGIDLVVSNNDKDSLVSQVSRKLAMPTMPEGATSPSSSALFARSRQRAFIKIQDGCRYRCTYCIVTVARGDERSRTISSIVDEVNQLSNSGIQEIVLTGVHVGGYGSDLNTNLYTLVDTLLSDTDIPRIRFASVEPWDLPDNFCSLFANKRLMPHMHLPLQSGSDSVLKRMARRCKTAEFQGLTDALRQSITGFNVTTDIIVGFPGETEREWQESCEFIDAIGFGHIHIFSFSAREGTKAARLSDQIHGAVKRKRSQHLHQIAREQKKRVLADMVGKRTEVLWESGRSMPVSERTNSLATSCTENNPVRFSGYTPNYHRVFTDVGEDTDLTNSLALTELRSMDTTTEQLRGSVLDIISSPVLNVASSERRRSLDPFDTGSVNNVSTVIPITPV